MPREAINQATCESCDDEDAEFTVTDTDFPDEIDGDEVVDTVLYSVRCTCGETGAVVIDADGVSASDGINHEDASWNQEGEDDE